MLKRIDPKLLRKSVIKYAVSGSFVKRIPEEGTGVDVLSRLEKIGIKDGHKVEKTKVEGTFSYPSHWAVARLSQIGFVTGGGTPDTNVAAYWVNGTFEWITPADMGAIRDFYLLPAKRKVTQLGIDNSSAKLLKTGSIVMSSRAPIGYIGINRIPTATSQGCKSLTLFDDSLVDARFVLLAIKAALPDIIGAASTMTFKEISGTKFGEVVIPIPPYEEQKRIVDKFLKIEPLLSEYEDLRERE
jgi:type I restriction enzyme, S subunit